MKKAKKKSRLFSEELVTDSVIEDNFNVPEIINREFVHEQSYPKEKKVYLALSYADDDGDRHEFLISGGAVKQAAKDSDIKVADLLVKEGGKVRLNEEKFNFSGDGENVEFLPKAKA